MAAISSYRDLEVWQKAMELVEAVYRLTEDLPDTERYGLKSQLQRSAVSIPSNIAEGYGRGSTKEYARFASIARGSLMELETQFALVVRLNLIDRDAVLPLWEVAQSVGKMLTALRRSLDRRLSSTKPQAPSPKPAS
ncbi:MAG: four helix bundle protein [Tepidisphaeraceae bacterium]